MTQTLVVEREMRHPVEKIWRALTESGLMDQWLLKNDFRPLVGHRFTLRTTPMPQWDGVVEGEVLVVEPGERLSYGWNAGGLQTVVTWTLTEIDGGSVRVRMEQAGFERETNYRGAVYGWEKFMAGLERVLAEM